MKQTKNMNKKTTRISDLNLREALLLLEKDDVSSELLEQALLDKRKGIALFFEEIAKKNSLTGNRALSTKRYLFFNRNLRSSS